MSLGHVVAHSDAVTVILAVLNVVQVVLLAHISSRSLRTRAHDREEMQPPSEDG